MTFTLFPQSCKPKSGAVSRVQDYQDPPSLGVKSGRQARVGFTHDTVPPSCHTICNDAN